MRTEDFENGTVICGSCGSYIKDCVCTKQRKKTAKKKIFEWSDGFGAAEFTVQCEPSYVRMIFRNFDGEKNHVVAQVHKDVYEQIFNFVVKKLGGRLDGY